MGLWSWGSSGAYGATEAITIDMEFAVGYVAND